MLECGLRAVVLHNKEVVWNYYAEFTADCRRINTKSLSTHYEHYKTDETKDNFIVSLPIGVHFFSVQNVHSEFAYDTGKNIWGFGTMLVFGIMSGYRAILYVTAHGELYIRHYVSNTPHVGWIKIK